MTNLIVLPVRNGLCYTRPAMETFLAQDIGNVHVMVIDNCSTDGTREYLHSLAEDAPVSVIFNSTPMSVAKSWNTGLRYAFEYMKLDYALVSNNDVLLRPDTFRHLVADGGLFVTAVGTLDKKKISPPYIEPDPAKKRKHPDFSCYLIREECWERVGAFDEEIQIGYGEDADMHIRMHRAGITAYCLELPFLHYASGTLKNSSPEERETIQKRADVNRQYFQQKYGFAIGTPEYYNSFHGPSSNPETLLDSDKDHT